MDEENKELNELKQDELGDEGPSEVPEIEHQPSQEAENNTVIIDNGMNKIHLSSNTSTMKELINYCRGMKKDFFSNGIKPKNYIR